METKDIIPELDVVMIANIHRNVLREGFTVEPSFLSMIKMALYLWNARPTNEVYYETEEEAVKYLTKAGFDQEELKYAKQTKMFNTRLLTKRSAING